MIKTSFISSIFILTLQKLKSMAKKKENWGGARANSGRKNLKDKKIGLLLYIRLSKIQDLGGKLALKEYIYNFLDKSEAKIN